MGDVLNGLFSSVVAVTGDAHQVQVQLLMGSLLTGACFGLLTDGGPEDYETEQGWLLFVQESWALLSFWSISLMIISMWYALHYQLKVSVNCRTRLLIQHRIIAPRDDVLSRM